MQRVKDVHLALRVDGAILERLHRIVFLFLQLREPITDLSGFCYGPLLFFPLLFKKKKLREAPFRGIVSVHCVRSEHDAIRT